MLSFGLFLGISTIYCTLLSADVPSQVSLLWISLVGIKTFLLFLYLSKRYGLFVKNCGSRILLSPINLKAILCTLVLYKGWPDFLSSLRLTRISWYRSWYLGSLATIGLAFLLYSYFWFEFLLKHFSLGLAFVGLDLLFILVDLKVVNISCTLALHCILKCNLVSQDWPMHVGPSLCAAIAVL